MDLRWLNPIPFDDIEAQVSATGRALVVDECRRTGGLAEPILAAIHERCPEARAVRVAADDWFIPLGAAANLVLVQEADIESAARKLLEIP